MVYIITYDLKTALRDYSSLYDAIKLACNGDYQHPMESVWIVDVPSSISIGDLYQRLRNEITDKDYLLITQMPQHYYGFLQKSVWAWLKTKVL